MTTRKRGSLCLEAAVVMPVLLMLLASLVIRIIAVECEIKVCGALDKTAAELSLISSICDLLESGNSLERAKVSDQACLNSIADSILEDLMLDFASSALAGPLIQKRFSLWLDLEHDGQPGWKHLVLSRKLFLDWDLSSRQLWLCLSYEIWTPAGTYDRSARSIVPIWSGEPSDEEDATGDQIWLLDNFSRGRIIRSRFGASLPFDFPVIAGFSGGEAVSIKSMDLTAPSYQDGQNINRRVSSHLNSLASFNGATYSKNSQRIKIGPADILSRKMILVVPNNYDHDRLQPYLEDLQDRAFTCGVRLEIVPYGKSTRYTQDESADRPSS